jgi:F-type H+-transporting ATPase subunit b
MVFLIAQIERFSEMISRLSRLMLCLLMTVVFGISTANAFEDKPQSHGAADAHGHYDPTHGYASAASKDLLDFKSDKALFTLLVFGLLCTGLYLVAWKPISEALARRETTIANQIAEAQKASEEAGAKLKEYEAKLADAAVKAQELVNQAKRDAEVVAERIKTDAQTDASRMVERARTEIETAKQAALSELSTRSTDLAFGLARRVIGRELNAGDHQKLISEAIGRLPSGN